MTDAREARADWHRKAIQSTRSTFAKPAAHIINRQRQAQQREAAVALAESIQSEFISMQEVAKRTSLSRGTLYNMVDRGEIAAPVRLTMGRLAFRRADYEAWKAKLAD